MIACYQRAGLRPIRLRPSFLGDWYAKLLCQQQLILCVGEKTLLWAAPGCLDAADESGAVASVALVDGRLPSQ